VRERGARRGRNPKTGDPVDIPAKRVPYFKPGKELKELINEDEEAGAKTAGTPDPEARPADPPQPDSAGGREGGGAGGGETPPLM
jgi:integration host factor subunit beta